MSRWRGWGSISFGGVAVAVLAGVLSGAGDRSFPHETHERLFPVCEGCHVGVVTGAESAMFPSPANCAQCHDGVREPLVEWETPVRPRVSNLQFSHPVHQDLVDREGNEVACASCHATEAGAPRMQVAAPQPTRCLECHVHESPVHLASTAQCTTCHVPLTDATLLTTEQIALFPWPESHDAPDFILEHAPGTPLEQLSCGVCHARDTCERCHVNADWLDAITALGRDDRVATLEQSLSAEYPVPESHLSRGWGWDHGEIAVGDPARCSTCHTQESCRTCHIEGNQPLAALAQLPIGVPGGAPGVDLEGAGEGVHPADFGRAHGTFAATGALQCAQCHTEQYCSDCHAGADSRGFHLDNFLERHALEVFAGSGDCQSCHSTETFCRDCHVASGVASGGGLDVAFHTAQPMWILAHGQAARIGLESCASCHRQTDCLACHSSVLGRGVSPHGPGFNAERMAARNRVTCRWCHLQDPLGQ